MHKINKAIAGATSCGTKPRTLKIKGERPKQDKSSSRRMLPCNTRNRLAAELLSFVGKLNPRCIYLENTNTIQPMLLDDEPTNSRRLKRISN